MQLTCWRPGMGFVAVELVCLVLSAELEGFWEYRCLFPSFFDLAFCLTRVINPFRALERPASAVSEGMSRLAQLLSRFQLRECNVADLRRAYFRRAERGGGRGVAGRGLYQGWVLRLSFMLGGMGGSFVCWGAANPLGRVYLYIYIYTYMHTWCLCVCASPRC